MPTRIAPMSRYTASEKSILAQTPHLLRKGWVRKYPNDQKRREGSNTKGMGPSNCASREKR